MPAFASSKGQVVEVALILVLVDRAVVRTQVVTLYWVAPAAQSLVAPKCRNCWEAVAVEVLHHTIQMPGLEGVY